MEYYKDINNKLHVLDDEKSIDLLPIGFVEIDEQEAIAIRDTPPFHEWDGSQYVVIDQAGKDVADAESVRVFDLETEKESVGLRKITVTQAHDKIDQIFDSATTVAQLKNATVLALKKIIPFVID